MPSIDTYEARIVTFGSVNNAVNKAIGILRGARYDAERRGIAKDEPQETGSWLVVSLISGTIIVLGVVAAITLAGDY